MTIREFREKVNLRLYSSKNAVTIIQRSIVALVSLTAFATLIYYYGYPQTEDSRETLISIFKFSFGVYIVNYIIKIIYDFEPSTFIKRTWFEGVLMLILVIEGISYNFFDTLILTSFFHQFGIEVTSYTNLLIQLYFIAVVFYEIGKSSNILPKIKLHPSNIFMGSFLIIILVGTGLLMLPEMSIASNGLNFIDALFMSTSATCVTGLTTVNVADFFTFKGQFIIMILIKLGGLNIIIFGSFIALASKFGLGIKQHSILEDFIDSNNIYSAKGILAKIILWSISFEIIGTIAYYLCWDLTVPFNSNGDRFFFSIFHSLSAFNNAGFSLFPNGFQDELVRDNFAIHNIAAAMIFIGALGFVAIFDIFRLSQIRERIKYPWKHFTLSTKISLYFSFGLIVFGWFFFYVFEAKNILAEDSFLESMSHSFFQSITTRTAGFNTVDIGALTIPAILLIIFLMFIGASSSSTGGGIKTSTFAILCASVLATVRGREHIQIFKRTIPNSIVFRAFSILVIFLVLEMLGIMLLTMTETEILKMPNYNILNLVFEEVSAFSTVGLSTGITPLLSPAGKVIITVSMFVGRVGMLTIAYAIGKEAISKRYRYPKGHIMVG